uniref:Uncharacterized protein n=1 Tax=Rhizophora mucronata TaxID=61149 RepID=A0A2P2KWA6_RHIMU
MWPPSHNKVTFLLPQCSPFKGVAGKMLLIPEENTSLKSDQIHISRQWAHLEAIWDEESFYS